MPTVSVILTCYNQETFIEKALRAIFEQTQPFYEVILVDDCSTDNSAEVIEKIRQIHPSLIVMRNTSNLTVGPARNRGVDAATGDYVWILDGDDWIEADAHEKIQACLGSKAPDILVVGFKAHVMVDQSQDKQDWSFEENHPSISSPFPETDADRAALLEYLPPAWLRVVRRDLLLKNNILFEDIIHQDITWSHLCHLHAKHVICTTEKLAHYRIHNNSQLRKSTDNYHELFTELWNRTTLAVEASPNLTPDFRKVFERNRFRLLCISLLQTDRYDAETKPKAAEYILSLYPEPPEQNAQFIGWMDQIRKLTLEKSRV